MNCFVLENYGFSITTTGRFISRALKTEVLISNTSLVGGFNPVEKNWSSWIISPGRGENKNCLKPPASHPWEKKHLTTGLIAWWIISGIKNRQLHQEKHRKRSPDKSVPHSLHQQNKTGKKEGQTRNPWQKAPTKDQGWVISHQQKNTVMILPTQTILKGNPSKIQYIGLSPLPLPVTTRIITFLVGNPYKPSFPLLLGRGDNPNNTCLLYDFPQIWMI